MSRRKISKDGDYTVNTQKELSDQNRKNKTVQVPFVLGELGFLRLRVSAPSPEN